MRVLHRRGRARARRRAAEPPPRGGHHRRPRRRSLRPVAPTRGGPGRAPAGPARARGPRARAAARRVSGAGAPDVRVVQRRTSARFRIGAVRARAPQQVRGGRRRGRALRAPRAASKSSRSRGWTRYGGGGGDGGGRARLRRRPLGRVENTARSRSSAETDLNSSASCARTRCHLLVRGGKRGGFLCESRLGTRFEEALFLREEEARIRNARRARVGRRTCGTGRSPVPVHGVDVSAGRERGGGSGRVRTRAGRRAARAFSAARCQRQDAQTGLARTWTPATARPGSTRETCRSPRARRTRAPAAAGRRPRADPRASSPRASCCGADNKRTHLISVD